MKNQGKKSGTSDKESKRLKKRQKKESLIDKILKLVKFLLKNYKELLTICIFVVVVIGLMIILTMVMLPDGITNIADIVK